MGRSRSRERNRTSKKSRRDRSREKSKHRKKRKDSSHKSKKSSSDKKRLKAEKKDKKIRDRQQKQVQKAQDVLQSILTMHEDAKPQILELVQKLISINDNDHETMIDISEYSYSDLLQFFLSNLGWKEEGRKFHRGKKTLSSTFPLIAVWSHILHDIDLKYAISLVVEMLIPQRAQYSDAIFQFENLFIQIEEHRLCPKVSNIKDEIVKRYLPEVLQHLGFKYDFFSDSYSATPSTPPMKKFVELVKPVYYKVDDQLLEISRMKLIINETDGGRNFSLKETHQAHRKLEALKAKYERDRQQRLGLRGRKSERRKKFFSEPKSLIDSSDLFKTDTVELMKYKTTIINSDVEQDSMQERFSSAGKLQKF